LPLYILAAFGICCTKLLFVNPKPGVRLTFGMTLGVGKDRVDCVHCLPVSDHLQHVANYYGFFFLLGPLLLDSPSAFSKGVFHDSLS